MCVHINRLICWMCLILSHVVTCINSFVITMDFLGECVGLQFHICVHMCADTRDIPRHYSRSCSPCFRDRVSYFYQNLVIWWGWLARKPRGSICLSSLASPAPPPPLPYWDHKHISLHHLLKNMDLGTKTQVSGLHRSNSTDWAISRAHLLSFQWLRFSGVLIISFKSFGYIHTWLKYKHEHVSSPSHCCDEVFWPKKNKGDKVDLSSHFKVQPDTAGKLRQPGLEGTGYIKSTLRRRNQWMHSCLPVLGSFLHLEHPESQTRKYAPYSRDFS